MPQEAIATGAVDDVVPLPNNRRKKSMAFPLSKDAVPSKYESNDSPAAWAWAAG